jgi:hypothetical protein
MGEDFREAVSETTLLLDLLTEELRQAEDAINVDPSRRRELVAEAKARALARYEEAMAGREAAAQAGMWAQFHAAVRTWLGAMDRADTAFAELASACARVHQLVPRERTLLETKAELAELVEDLSVEARRISECGVHTLSRIATRVREAMRA